MTRWGRRMMVALAAGAMAMAFTASCDPLTGGLYIDRYDDDGIYYYDDCDFFDMLFGCDNGYYVEEEIVFYEEWF